MERVRNARGWVLVVAMTALAGLATARAADPVDWRSRVLALNDITGDHPIEGEIKTLVDEPANAKKLLTAALPLAKDKNQPFNYNAAYILGRTAYQLKDYQASLVFFRLCTEQAVKIRSLRKLIWPVDYMLRVVDKLYADKKYEETAKLCQELLELMERERLSDELKDGVFRKLVQALYKQGKTDEAFRMVDTLLKARGGSWRNLELKAQLQHDTGKTADAVKTYVDVIPLIAKDRNINKWEQVSLQAQLHYQISRLYKDLKRSREAEEQLQAAAKADEEALRLVDADKNLSQRERIVNVAELHSSLSQMYDALKRPEKAEEHLKASVKTYENFLTLISQDKDLDKEARAKVENSIHYTLSSLYVDLRLIDKATEHLRILLTEKPNDPTYNNDLGYIWADHDMNLDEAEQMIRKALDEDRKQKLEADPNLKPAEVKDNSAYLDSLGWVLFKKKKYQEALPPLEKAILDKEGQHIEIFDHLGDVYMALGEKAKAVDAWKKGLKATGPSKREQERKVQVEKKLQEIGETVKKNP